MQLQFVKTALSWAAKNQTVIKAVLAGVGVVTTGVTAVRAGYKAKEVIAEKEELLGEELTTSEKVVETWPLFIAPVVAAGASIVCIYSGTNGALKDLAAVGALYSATRKDLKMTKDAIAEIEGPTMVRKVMDRVNEKKEESSVNKEVILTDKGNTLCYDCFSGRYFRGDIEKIRSCANDIMSDVYKLDTQCLNDFYFLLGLEPLPIGDEVVWTWEHPLDISFTSKLTDNMEPCVVMSYEVFPKIGW